MDESWQRKYEKQLLHIIGSFRNEHDDSIQLPLRKYFLFDFTVMSLYFPFCYVYTMFRKVRVKLFLETYLPYFHIVNYN